MLNSQSNQLQALNSVAPTSIPSQGQQASVLSPGSALEQAGSLNLGGRLFGGASDSISSTATPTPGGPVAATPDFIGNTRGTAYNIGDLNNFNFNWNDSVSSGDRDDYFRFNMTNAGTANFSLNGLSNDADIYLYNSSGTQIAYSNRGGAQSESISRYLSSGTYYLQVHSYNGTSTNYHLNASGSGPATDPGSSIYTSHDLGNVSRGTRSWNDYVGSGDANDYFHVQLSESGNLQVRLSGLSADADVALYDRYGSQITYSNHAGTSSESISRNLSAGDYYVRVYQYSGSTNYRLDLTTTGSYASSANVPANPLSANVPANASARTLASSPVSLEALTPGGPVAATPDFIGNTRGTAYNIGDLNNFNFNWNDSVSSGDRDDYFRFSMTNAGTANFSLNGLSGDADIHLYNSSGTEIAYSMNGSSSPESISRYLSSGTYYLQVHSFAGASTNYHLTASGSGPATDPGSSISTSHDLGNVSRGSRSWNDYVGSGDANDYFHVQLSESGNLQVRLSGLSADADVAIYNRYGNQIAYSNHAGTSSESISRYLGAGDYYVRVYQYSGSTNYRLDVNT